MHLQMHFGPMKKIMKSLSTLFVPKPIHRHHSYSPPLPIIVPSPNHPSQSSFNKKDNDCTCTHIHKVQFNVVDVEAPVVATVQCVQSSLTHSAVKEGSKQLCLPISNASNWVVQMKGMANPQGSRVQVKIPMGPGQDVVTCVTRAWPVRVWGYFYFGGNTVGDSQTR